MTFGALVAVEWTRLTGTQVGVFGSLTGVAIAVTTLLVGHRNEARRAAQALEAERLRIVAAREVEELRVAAAREVEELRITAAAEADTRRWVRDELRSALVEVFAGVERVLDAWREAAVARDKWLAVSGSAPEYQSVAGILEAGKASGDALGAAIEQWESLDLNLTGLGLVGSPAILEAAGELHRSFGSMRHHLRPQSPVGSNVVAFEADTVLVMAARDRLLSVVRVELGLGPLAGLD